jgi:hypothetical protein
MTGVRQGQSMNEEKTEYRKAIAGTGERGWVRDALNLIRKPRGDLQAMTLKMKRSHQAHQYRCYSTNLARPMFVNHH